LWKRGEQVLTGKEEDRGVMARSSELHENFPLESFISDLVQGLGSSVF
jgi:hypothetical protein